MTFTETILKKAHLSQKSIVLPEATEEKILLAARKVADIGAARPLLLGNPDEISAAANNAGISLTGIEVVDSGDEAFKTKLISDFLAVSDDFSEKALNRKFREPLNIAAAMVRVGYADSLGAGLTRSTGEVILTAQLLIGMQEGISTVSSIGMAEFPNFDGPEGNMLCFTDCAVNMKPSSAELADIAITSAHTVRALLGWEPRVAMLSFSTKGSGEHEDVEKVRKAVEIAKSRKPDLLIDGELQLDAAIIPEVAKKKIRDDSPVAGRANIIVFPDLGAGNIGVKMAQIFGGAVAHGPLLQGFAKPVTDFSRSAPVEEIVGNLVMLAVYVQNQQSA